MRNMTLVAAGLLVASWIVVSPADACMGCPSAFGYQQVYPAYPAYPFLPPGAYAPPVYYYPPPAFYFGSGYDPDYIDIRYNRYFQRYQPPPEIRGYTLPR